MSIDDKLVAYYAERAKEYEKIYSKPERQDDLRLASSILKGIFKNRDVLEICCGTGYWTKEIALAAKSVYATDINEAMLEIARHKVYEKQNVSFGIADIFNFRPAEKFDCLFGGFIWSHIPVQDLAIFLQKVSGFANDGATIVFMDNNFVQGSNLPIAHTDAEGNTYQLRSLDDGTSHRVRKNFPTEEFLRSAINGFATTIKIDSLKYFWILTYTKCT